MKFQIQAGEQSQQAEVRCMGCDVHNFLDYIRDGITQYGPPKPQTVLELSDKLIEALDNHVGGEAGVALAMAICRYMRIVEEKTGEKFETCLSKGAPHKEVVH